MKNLGYKESVISQAENILRLEVALKRKWIRKQFDSDNKNMLYKVFVQSDSIIKYYFIKLFGDGCYVSKNISKIATL